MIIFPQLFEYVADRIFLVSKTRVYDDTLFTTILFQAASLPQEYLSCPVEILVCENGFEV